MSDKDKECINFSNNGLCLICFHCEVMIDDDNYLQCSDCQRYKHIRCLKNGCTPGDLLGDVFFDFTCLDCVQKTHSTSLLICEKFKRQHLPWVLVTILAIYNLSIKSKGLSYHGYFHWRSHIINFIEKYWEYMFRSNVRKPKQWVGTISGMLSHHCPNYFCSGAKVTNEGGWWKLTHSKLTPKAIYDIFLNENLKRNKLRLGKRKIDNNGTSIKVESNSPQINYNSPELSADLLNIYSFSRAIPYMGRGPKNFKKLKCLIKEEDKDHLEKQYKEQVSTLQTNLMDYFEENISDHNLNLNDFSNIDSTEDLINTDKNDIFSFIPNHDVHSDLFEIPAVKQEPLNHEALFSNAETEFDKISAKDNYDDEDNCIFLDNDSEQKAYDDKDETDEKYRPRILQVTKFEIRNDDSQQTMSIPDGTNFENETQIKPSQINDNFQRNQDPFANDLIVDQNDENEDLPTLCEKSLFTKNPRRVYPWLIHRNYDEEEAIKLLPQIVPRDDEELCLMNEFEERDLLEKLREIFAHEGEELNIPFFIRRVYRRLCLREWKRSHYKQIINIEDDMETETPNVNIIDQYQLLSMAPLQSRKTFQARIVGSIEHEMFESPYTHRILHPFIYRNKDYFPPWLKLMCEIQHAKTGVPPTRSSIDFCYVRPNHIAAVNALLQFTFWPGIDMTECLSYPDFSVVALYKKLVIGCGFLVPDVGYNEAYISFMAVRPGWQRSGIATFMLYHLIQTCMSKDITLHVSATNNAVLLYQKFGFKIEEVLPNFYDKYLPYYSRQSRHALLLRLARS